MKVALGVSLTGKPICKCVSQIENEPFMPSFVGGKLKFFDPGAKPEFVIFVIHAENNSLGCSSISPWNGNELGIGVQ